MGVTFSFLISSPMVDLGSLVLLMSIFGARVAVIYVVLGLVIAVIGGTIIEKLHMEQEVEGFIRSAERVDLEIPEQTCRERAAYAGGQMLSTFCKSLSLYSGGSRTGGDHPQLDPGKLGRDGAGG